MATSFKNYAQKKHKMKKILTVLFAVLTVMAAQAQDAKAAELISKGSEEFERIREALE